MKKTIALVLSVLLLLGALSGCGLKKAVESGVGALSGKGFLEWVEAGNAEKAIEVYRSRIQGKTAEEQTARQDLESYLDANWQAYVDGEVEESVFEQILSTVEAVNDELHILRSFNTISWNFQQVKQSKANYEQGVSSAEAGDYEAAMSAFSQVISDDAENYDRAQAAYDEARANYRAQLETAANAAADAGNYQEAVDMIRGAGRVLGQGEELDALMKQICTRRSAEQIAAAAAQGDHLNAVLLYEAALEDEWVEISAEMTQSYAASVNAYCDGVAAQAAAAFGTGKDYEAALAVIRTALAEANASPELTARLEAMAEEYQAYIPVPLTSLEPTQKAYYIELGSSYTSSSIYTDANGRTYDSSNLIYPLPDGSSLASETPDGENEAYVQYNLNYAYSTLSGVVFRTYGSLSAQPWTQPTTVRIYGDDVLLYEAPGYTSDMYDSVAFTVDVSGVRNLRIVVMGRWVQDSGWVGLYDRQPKVCLGELMLQK